MTVSLPPCATTAFWFDHGVGSGKAAQAGRNSFADAFWQHDHSERLVVYIASNFEKVLLGRFWGAEAIGIYGRAYQLSRIPTDNFNGASAKWHFRRCPGSRMIPIASRATS